MSKILTSHQFNDGLIIDTHNTDKDSEHNKNNTSSIPDILQRKESISENYLHRKIVPGLKTYSRAHVRTTLIISDSTISRIPVRALKNNIDLECEEVIMKKYPGQTTKEISHNSIIPLEEIRPEQVIIVAGTNDISNGYRGKTLNEHKIVEDILSIAYKAKAVGTENIFISSILVRWGYHYKNIPRVNNILEAMCHELGFIYLDQSDVTTLSRIS